MPNDNRTRRLVNNTANEMAYFKRIEWPSLLFSIMMVMLSSVSERKLNQLENGQPAG